MKRYLLFAGETYYPCGGWGDLQGVFGTPTAARREIESQTFPWDWWQIVDVETGSICESSSVDKF